MNLEDLQEIVQLAHLPLDEGELAGAVSSFEQMLDFFALMLEADENLEAAPGLTVDSRHFRSDRGEAFSWENLLDNAEDRDGNFVVIPNVL
ncbi:MAG: aspartyl/glutamyl-tRNA amidotransferase subunit C [Spirochaetaceae bacterium]|jgi:aspartyl/glutamyl-tRNA(Asn/Gln) amidotransferase C subunit|nr:aspartyl/glutamyl-tRNA amidotransferase subunit C [Spirochaetaceae bacterium]